MIVSWNWLKEYVRLDMPVESLTDRLMMAGLNLEQVTDVDGDLAIDLEVTSNRPDCLGHLGIAREVGVLFDRPLQPPAAAPQEQGPPAASLTSVEIQCPDVCPQYLARVVRGVKVGPSPAWLRRRLATLGLRSINNVVDITNYVLMECGQPLHAFDFDKLQGGRIVVRHAAPGEKLTAIDQQVYALQPGMCVIADAARPVAIAGLMGGLDTEITDQTVNVLIEVAEFSSMSVRATARKLSLHSDSSYRFERGVDRNNLDWASRRCAQLILDLAGGTLASGVAGTVQPVVREPIRLRFAQIRRILGSEIPRDEVLRILTALGLEPSGQPHDDSAEFLPPSWRRDLSREIDLIEEVARIYGYDKIPENVLVPLAVSTKPLRDRIADRLGEVLRAAGVFEAVTLSFVEEKLARLFHPWTDAPPLAVDHSSRRNENLLRQSMVPSLLSVRRLNERHGNFNVALYEMASVYLAPEPARPEAQPNLLAVVSGKSFSELKGVVESLARSINRAACVSVKPSELPQFKPGRGCEVLLNGVRWGWLGELADDVQHAVELQDPVSVVELDLAVLEPVADLTPLFVPVPQFPAIERDLNFVLDEPVTWQELEQTVRSAAGPLLETVAFASQYRGPQIPPNKKSYVVRVHYRAPDRTLTTEEVDAAQQSVLAACQQQLAAALR